VIGKNDMILAFGSCESDLL